MKSPSVFREKDGRPMPDMAVGTMRLGRWGAGLDTAGFRAFIEACLEAGLDLFDHADIYGDYTTEEAFGRALAEAPGLRDRLRLVTKCGIQLVTDNRPGTRLKHYDTSADHLRASVDASLAALRTDRIELLLVHRPDPLMDPHAVADAFAGLREAGKVRAFGVSNFSPAQVAALRAVWPDLATNQVEASPMHRAPFLDGTFDGAPAAGMRPMAWSPLAGGRLLSPEGDPLRARLERLAPKYGVDPIALVYAWLMRHPSGIVPVTGTTDPARIRQAAAALDVRLERQDWFDLWTAAGGEVP